MKKRILSVVLSAVMFISVLALVPTKKSIMTHQTVYADATAHTADDAIAWCQSKIGKTVDNGQCVGFINGYMDYLGVNHYNYLVSVAADFRYERFCPPGWQQKAGVQPQKGDILIYTGGAGHVAIYESDYATYHQNYNGQLVTKVTSLKYNEFVNPYWGVLRPNFGSNKPDGHIMTEAEGAGQTIPDGDYWICSKIDPKLFLELPGYSVVTENGAAAQTYNYTDMPTASDGWTVTYRGNGYYKITQKGGALCLDDYGGSVAWGTPVDVWESNNANSQQWSIVRTPNGFKLQSRCDAFYATVPNGSNADGVQLKMMEAMTDPAQFWAFIPYDPDERPLPDGEYKIKNINNTEWGLDVDGTADKYADGSNLQIKHDPDDIFELTYVSNGFYKITEASSGLALSLDLTHPSDSFNSGLNVLMRKYNGSRNMLWKIRKTTDGYVIYSKYNGFCLYLERADCVDGTNVFQCIYYPNLNNLVWDLESCSEALKGDVNNDGKVAVADLVLLKKWLLTETGELPDWKLADVCEDGVIDVYDIVALRKLVI